MTRVSIIQFEDVDDDTLTKIMALVGQGPGDLSTLVDGQPVSVPRPPTNGNGHSAPTGWDAETARLFVDGLTAQAFKALTIVTEHSGSVSLDIVIDRLNLSGGKALGGVMSSFGHNIRLLVHAGRLPPNMRVVERNDETRQFHTVVPAKVLRLLTSAVARRARIEAGRSAPEGVAEVA